MPAFEVDQILSHFSATIIILSRTPASSTPCNRRHEKLQWGLRKWRTKNAHYDHALCCRRNGFTPSSEPHVILVSSGPGICWHCPESSLCLDGTAGSSLHFVRHFIPELLGCLLCCKLRRFAFLALPSCSLKTMQRTDEMDDILGHFPWQLPQAV